MGASKQPWVQAVYSLIFISSKQHSGDSIRPPGNNVCVECKHSCKPTVPHPPIQFGRCFGGKAKLGAQLTVCEVERRSHVMQCRDDLEEKDVLAAKGEQKD